MVPIKTHYTTSESHSVLYIFQEEVLEKTTKTPSRSTNTVCLGSHLVQHLHFVALALFNSLWVSKMYPSFSRHGAESSGGWLPERRDLQWCDPRKWGGTEGADSHPSQTVPWDQPRCALRLSTVHFVLLEIQYTFIFSLSSPHFTTRTEPTKTHGSSMRHNRSWVLHELLSMATNCNRSAVSLLLQMTRSSEWPER